MLRHLAFDERSVAVGRPREALREAGVDLLAELQRVETVVDGPERLLQTSERGFDVVGREPSETRLDELDGVRTPTMALMLRRVLAAPR